jgi:hypothetical protein
MMQSKVVQEAMARAATREVFTREARETAWRRI